MSLQKARNLKLALNCKEREGTFTARDIAQLQPELTPDYVASIINRKLDPAGCVRRLGKSCMYQVHLAWCNERQHSPRTCLLFK